VERELILTDADHDARVDPPGKQTAKGTLIQFCLARDFSLRRISVARVVNRQIFRAIFLWRNDPVQFPWRECPTTPSVIRMARNSDTLASISKPRE